MVIYGRLHAHEEVVRSVYCMLDILDDVDMLHVKINRVVVIILLGI